MEPHRGDRPSTEGPTTESSTPPRSFDSVGVISRDRKLGRGGYMANPIARTESILPLRNVNFLLTA